MRLTQPFRGWQLAILFAAGFPALATAQTLDQVTRSQALEPDDFPRDVVLVGDLPETIGEEAFDEAARASMDAWNDVSCSVAELRYAGRVDTLADAPADATTVAFVDGATEPCFGIENDVGWTLFSGCDDWAPTAVLLNTNGFVWAADPDPYSSDVLVDVRSVLTHELGHSLGLVHADVSDPLATMAPRYLRDGGLSTLAADDKLALCALYGTPEDECVSDADCPGACVEGEFAVCDELRVEAGGYCDLGELNCAGSPACLVTSPATYSGYCSPACTADDDCPDDMMCEEDQCRFAAVPAGDDGCSTTRGAAPSIWWWFVAGWLAIRRRRS